MSEQPPAPVASTSTTVVEQEEKKPEEGAEGGEPNTVKLKLKKKPSERKKVNWTEETVDNEGLGRKKSKCCCIYVKPKKFGEESSGDETSDSDSDCKDCSGHHGKDLNSDRDKQGGGGGGEQKVA